jgi:hypothetical protein
MYYNIYLQRLWKSTKNYVLLAGFRSSIRNCELLDSKPEWQALKSNAVFGLSFPETSGRKFRTVSLRGRVLLEDNVVIKLGDKTDTFIKPKRPTRSHKQHVGIYLDLGELSRHFHTFLLYTSLLCGHAFKCISSNSVLSSHLT